MNMYFTHQRYWWQPEDKKMIGNHGDDSADVGCEEHLNSAGIYKGINWDGKLTNADGSDIYKLPNGFTTDPTVQKVSTFTEESRNDTYIDYWVYKNTGLPVNKSLSDDFRVMNLDV